MVVLWACVGCVSRLNSGVAWWPRSGLPRFATRLGDGSPFLSFALGTLPVRVGALLDFLGILGAAIPSCVCAAEIGPGVFCSLFLAVPVGYV